MSDLYFTSDEHYGHANVIRFCDRPFKHINEHIEESIKRHNAVVPKGARVIHLGDMFWRTLPLKTAIDITYALNGQHYFIWGNHDELIEKNKILRDRFVWCKDIAQIDHPLLTQKLVVCHYAMHVWRNSHKGAYHLYGHTHANLPEQKNLSFDCGQDANDFTPISIEGVIERMKKKSALGHEDAMIPIMKKQRWEGKEASD
jgi:calcineurin-like phosphoesterase family protein